MSSKVRPYLHPLRVVATLGGIVAMLLGSGGAAAAPQPGPPAQPAPQSIAMTNDGPGFGPGDVYREFLYSQFVTTACDNGATNAEATLCRANEANFIRRDLNLNLSNVTSAELVMEHWAGHIATDPQQYRINSSSPADWRDLPEWGGLPGPEKCYLRINLGKSIVPLSLSQLVNGVNTFDFFSGPQDPTGCAGPGANFYNYGWGLYYIYSFAVRAYLDPAQVSYPTALLSSPTGAVIGDNPTFSVDISGSPVPIQRIELIGNFFDYDWDGNGIYKEWQYFLKKPTTNNLSSSNAWWVRGNIGSANVVPDQSVYNFTWNTRYVPDQDEPVLIMARLIGADGVIANTQPLSLRFERSGGLSVELITTGVIENYAVRTNARKDGPFNIPATSPFFARRANVIGNVNDINEVSLLLSTWGGKPETKEQLVVDGEEQIIETTLSLRNPQTGVNLTIATNRICNVDESGNCLADPSRQPSDQFGVNGDYDIDRVAVPGSVVQAINPSNQLRIFSNRRTHGLEINWPGPGLLVRYRGTQARDRSYEISEDTATPVQLVGDTSRTSNGAPLTLFYRVKTQPEHGSLSGAPNSSGAGLSYVPDQDYNGPDSFTFEVSTTSNFSGDVWAGTVSLNVTPLNDAPLLNVGSDTSVKLNTALVRGGTFSDPDADTWTGTVDYGEGAGPQPLAINPDRTFSLNHVYNQLGIFTVTVTVNDGNGGSDSASFNVTVASDPVVANDDTINIEVGQAAVVNVLANDSEGAGGRTVTISIPPTHGSAVVNQDGTITYTPNPNFAGSDDFEYRVRDSANSVSTARVFITVSSDPLIAADDEASTLPNASVTIAVLANDSQGEGGRTVAITRLPSNGTTAINPDGTITYTPSPGFIGSDSFTYRVTDLVGSTSTATVFITVAGSGGAPTNQVYLPLLRR